MLTPTDKRNLKNFWSLTSNHQRVFKFRLKNKCVSALKDVEFVLSNYEKLNIKVNKILDINQLVNLLEWYERLCLLQNV